MRFGHGFDSLSAFMATAYETAATEWPSTPLAPLPPAEQVVLDDIQRKLVTLEQDAKQRSDPPLARFAKQLNEAWTARWNDKPFDPKLVAQLEKAKTELEAGDGFGPPRRLPEEVDRALISLATQPERPTPENPHAGHEVDLEAEVALAEAQFAAENPGMSLYDDAGEINDAKVKAFVQKYYSEEFEPAATESEQATPQSEKEILATLPKTEREKLLKLPAAERAFLLHADPAHQIVHAQMPPAEAKLFAAMKPAERGQYLAMNADEKVFFRSLNPDERKLYLTLNPGSRTEFRSVTPQERSTKVAEWKTKQAQDAGKPIEQAAPELADSVLADLGMDPVRDVSIREKARALAFNYLKQTPNDRAAAEAGLKKALLSDPTVLEPLLDDLEEALDREPTASDAPALGKKFEDEDETAEAKKKPKKSAARSSLDDQPPRRARVGEYAQHFARIRQTLPRLAEQMVQPGMTRKQMIEGMKNAVVVSAELAAAYPNRPRGTRASALFGKREIVA